MNVNEIWNESIKLLKKYNIEKPRFEAMLLISHSLNLRPDTLIAKDDQILSENDISTIQQIVNLRCTRYPFAYIKGEQDFYSRSFIVSKEVLIPRPETEELIEWVIELKVPCNEILDICTGSGCIGITLGLETQANHVLLADISTPAIQIAQRNIELLTKGLNMNIETLTSDLYYSMENHLYDIIISNPPYVLPEEYELLMDDVRLYEPEIALKVTDPGHFMSRLILGAVDHLKSKGWIFIETNPLLIESTISIMELAGMKHIETKKDLSGKTRFIKAMKH
jgi:release factor glutamine methyltransferase